VIPVTLVAITVMLCTQRALGAPVRQRTPVQVDGRALGTFVFTHLRFDAPSVREVQGLSGRHIVMLNQELKRLGFRIPDDAIKAALGRKIPHTDYVLYGTISEFQCSKLLATLCGISVRWTVLDNQRQQVVLRVLTKHEEKAMDELTSQQAGEALLLGCLHSLLSRTVFAQALKRPRVKAAEAPEPGNRGASNEAPGGRTAQVLAPSVASRSSRVAEGRPSNASGSNQPRVSPGPMSSASVIAEDDEDWFYLNNQAVADRTRWTSALRVWGYAATAAGVVTVFVTWEAQRASEDRFRDYERYRDLNTQGWGVGIVGVGAVISSYLLEPEPKVSADASQSLTLKPVIGLGRVTLSGSF
jgi:hypothetical protein